MTLHTVSQWSFSGCLGLLTVLSAFGGAGCSQGEVSRLERPRPLPVIPRGDVSTLTGEVIALDDLLPVDAELVGVGVDPEGGDLYVLDARRGVYALGQGSATLVFDLPASTGVGSDGSGIDVPTELTDLALRSGATGTELIVTAENDGFLANPNNQVLSSFFCYLPPSPGEGGREREVITVPLSVSQEARLAGINVVERTEAIAIDPWSGEIYAQPRTLRVDGGEVLGSEIFRFDPFGGDAPIELQRLASSDFVAGGMLVDTLSRLLLGQGPNLFASSLTGDGLVHFARVDAEITGLAFDGVRDRMLVLDGPARAIYAIDYSSVRNLSAFR